ncbi:MAG TPA: hypothetical protein VEA58_06565 [Anaerovoracaceae bacterium]|nr:hypothetical protein [Anaerovoracaceae bacterium]
MSDNKQTVVISCLAPLTDAEFETIKLRFENLQRIVVQKNGQFELLISQPQVEQAKIGTALSIGIEGGLQVEYTNPEVLYLLGMVTGDIVSEKMSSSQSGLSDQGGQSSRVI